MKKRLLALITGAALVGTLLAGCGSTSENTESPDAAGNTGSASGGGWPSGPVSIVVPASAGGGTDLLARVLAEKLTAKLGQSFVVVNVTGAGGSSGINQVHEAAPDGNTILFFHNALLINNVTGVSDYSYEGFAVGPHVVTDNATGFYVSADAPYSTYPELIDYCKEHPGEVTMGVEVGGFTYMMVKSFEAATGVQFNLVDVGSNSDKCTALLGGHIDIMPNQYSTAKGYIESGDFVALGFPAEERSAVYPDVPTAKEQGVDWLYNGYEFGFFLPKDTPKDIQDTFDTAVAELMEDEDILEAGIRIIAQPPGKKLQNMMQLSGGEKALTAISLLFAIQNLKPSPFCLLDEIEAALDDSNVTRFAQYLHKLTKNTQFIVITHRRGTMTAADRLYGITMQEKGVSTMVSVSLLENELNEMEKQHQQ